MKTSQDQPEKFKLAPVNIAEAKKKQLKQMFPEVFCEDQIDWKKLKVLLGKDLYTNGERYHIDWAGKSDCLLKIQQPTRATLRPCRGESVDWETTGNLFIEGDNLEVLKILNRSYASKVKMIYIDPPYNTGKEFIYSDKHLQTIDDYLRYTGQVDGNGHKFANGQEDVNGRFHSKWMNMIYPRLFWARNFLREDGVIFISIDDNEVHNLRKICDEIFGEENFIAILIWNNSTGGGLQKKHFNQNNEYILCYGKNASQIPPFKAPMSSTAQEQYNKEDERGKYREQQFAWQNPSKGKNQKYPIETPDGTKIIPKEGYLYRFVEKTFREKQNQQIIVFKKTKNSSFTTIDGKETTWSISVKDYLEDGKATPTTLLPKEYVKMNIEAVNEIKRLFDYKIMEYTKPTSLLTYLMNIATEKDSLVMDFFAGSATTAHAVMQLNKEDGGHRRYICIQLPEPLKPNTDAYKAGMRTIADIGKERLRRAIKQLKSANNGQRSFTDNGRDLGFKVLKLDKSNFRVWDENTPKNIKKEVQIHFEEFIDPKSSQEDMLYEILLELGFDITTKIEVIKLDGNIIYSIKNVEGLVTFICLERKFTSRLFFKKLVMIKPHRVICLDSSFPKESPLLYNAYSICQQLGVKDFKVI